MMKVRYFLRLFLVQSTNIRYNYGKNMSGALNRNKLEELINQLQTTPLNASQVFSNNVSYWKELGFNQTQVKLWLNSLPLRNHQEEEPAAYSAPPDITAHLLSLLQQTGGRIPLAQVLRKLPAGTITSEQQIRKLAQQHAQLEIKGPWLVLVN